MLWDKVLLCGCVLLLMGGTWATTYDMENCNYAGFLDVPETSPVTVNGGKLTNPFVPSPCSIVFRATNPEHTLTIKITVLNLIDCKVFLDFDYGTDRKRFECGTVNPGEIYTNMRKLTVWFTKGENAGSYQFQFILTSSKPLPANPGDTSNPAEVGLIVGIVAGVFGFLLFVAILVVCCHKRAQKAKLQYMADQHKRPLEEKGRTPVSVGFSNNTAPNGYGHESSPRAKTKLLSETNGSSSPRTNRPKALNLYTGSKPDASDSKNGQVGPKMSANNEHFQDDDDTYDKTEDMKRPPKSPFLSDLASNVKFKASHSSNNKEAEERAKRMSSTSSSVGSSGASRDSPPPLPVVQVSKSPGTKRKNHASIRRAYRTTSSSEEEFNQIAAMRANVDDSGPSSSEVVPIKNPEKSNAQHSLKPDKNKKKGNNKDMKLQDYEPSSGNFQKNTARASKRAQKSPRLGNRGDGFGHRRTRSEARSEGEESRPGTPTSICDLESLPPLTRSGSRQSLYASRSSLYRRRGRKGSYTESIASTNYVHDDMEVGRHSRSYSQDYDDETDGGYEKPIGRRERERIFRSLGDLGRETKERSTQTLRETATQTGQEKSVIMEPKRIVKKKRRSKSMSAVGTQTIKKKEKAESREDEAEDSSEKPRPKPKPKPRKSMNSISTVSAVEDSDDGKKRKKKKKKRAQSKEDLSYADVPVPLPEPQVPGSDVLQSGMATQMPFAQYQMPPGTVPQQFIPGGPPIQVYPGGYPGGTLPMSVNPQTGYIMQPPPQQAVPQQPAHIPGKPRKSNWETLCQITEADHQQKQSAMTETGSLASSVFTNNLPSHVGHPVLQGHPGLQMPATQGHLGLQIPTHQGHPGFQIPQTQGQLPPAQVNLAYSNMAYPMTAVAAVPQTETMTRVPPSYLDAVHMSGASSVGYSSGHQSGSDSGGPVVITSDRTNLLPKKSSWEVLEEIAKNQKNESVV